MDLIVIIIIVVVVVIIIIIIQGDGSTSRVPHSRLLLAGVLLGSLLCAHHFSHCPAGSVDAKRSWAPALG